MYSVARECDSGNVNSKVCFTLVRSSVFMLWNLLLVISLVQLLSKCICVKFKFNFTSCEVPFSLSIFSFLWYNVI